MWTTPSVGMYALAVFAISGVYVHFRGKVRKHPLKQLTDHSTILAPVNCLLYLFSRVPAQPYLSSDLFPQLKRLEENWEVIRDEALALDDAQRIISLEDYKDAGFNSFFRTGWKRFYLKWYGNDLVSARKWCPKTCALLDEIPQIKAAMFTSLPPGGRLVTHRDPYAGSLRYHLGLDVPAQAGCTLYVDGEPYRWQNGQSIIFDETFLHYAENQTDERRIILFCDVRRPLRCAPIRWLEALFARVVMGSALSYNTKDDRVGSLNYLFSKIYRVRLIGKALKRHSPPVYYLVKYILLAGAVYWIFF